MEFFSDIFHAFDTIYIGGGTPSLLAIEQINDLLNAACKLFDINKQSEITIEINPGDVSYAYFQSLRASGINRLNIGVQSFDDNILKFLGRRHTSAEAVSAIDAARKAGFENIGIDLIYGVSGQDMKMWRQTLNQALSSSPEHLSCYQLSLDKNTPLYIRYRQDNLSMPTEHESLDFFFVHFTSANRSWIYSLRSFQLCPNPFI